MSVRGENCLGAYRQSAVLLPALAVILWQFGLFDEDDGLFTISHISDEVFIFGSSSLMLWGHS